MEIVSTKLPPVFSLRKNDLIVDIGILILRIGAPLSLAYIHGYGKWDHFEELSEKFADPLNVGSSISLALAIFAELICAVAVMFGLFTRPLLIPMAISFCVIVFGVHSGETVGERELAILYLILFSGLLALGPGRFSVDHLIHLRMNRYLKKKY